MTTKMKGLLKGLRYISQIFDAKEPEMQIGFPTDVKHVAHIGWDGPTVSPPSWMNEFRSAPLSTVGGSDEVVMADQTPARFPSHDFSSMLDLPTPEMRDPAVPPKPRRHSTSGVSDNAADSPARPHGIPRRSRRNKSVEGSEDGGSALGNPADSPVRDGPQVPRAARKKKPKQGGGEGSSRSTKSRSKAGLLPDGDRPVKEGSTESFPVIPSPGREEMCSSVGSS